MEENDMSANVAVRPFLLKPQWMNGLSERLLVSHYVNNNGGALGADFSTGGGAIGADLIRTPTSLFGLAVSGGQSNVSLNTNPENGTVSFVQFGVYGAQALDYGAAMDGALSYAHNFYDVTRGIVLPGTSRTATSSHGGNDVVLDVGLSRPVPIDSWQITPRVGLSYFHIDQASFSEGGAGSLDLVVNPAALNALYTRVGFAIAQPIMLGGTSILPEFRAAWLHNFLDTQGQFAASFIGTGTASFSQVGAPVGRDAGDIGAALEYAEQLSRLSPNDRDLTRLTNELRARLGR